MQGRIFNDYLNFENSFGNHGQQNFRRVTQYSGLVFTEPEKVDGNALDRWKKVVLIAFGQKKMFKMWKPAVLHFLFMRLFF